MLVWGSRVRYIMLHPPVLPGFSPSILNKSMTKTAPRLCSPNSRCRICAHWRCTRLKKGRRQMCRRFITNFRINIAVVMQLLNYYIYIYMCVFTSTENTQQSKSGLLLSAHACGVFFKDDISGKNGWCDHSKWEKNRAWMTIVSCWHQQKVIQSA